MVRPAPGSATSPVLGSFTPPVALAGSLTSSHGPSSPRRVFAGAPFIDINAPLAGTAITASRLRAGWVAGAGVEWAFARTWTVKLEYLHFDTQSELLSSGTFNFSCPPPLTPVSSAVTAQTSNLTLDTVRVGVNYTFN